MSAIVVRLGEEGPEAFDLWVVEEVSRVLLHLRDRVRDATPDRPVLVPVVVLDAPRAGPAPAAAAAVEALRGVVHAATAELGAAARVNLVLARPGQEGDLEQALGFLAESEMTLGATLDLRSPG